MTSCDLLKYLNKNKNRYEIMLMYAEKYKILRKYHNAEIIATHIINEVD